MCTSFFVLIVTLTAFGQPVCQCDKYDAIFKNYRQAKDAGDNQLVEKIATELAHDSVPFCKILGLNLLANVKVNNAQMAAGLILINQEKSLLDSIACTSESYLEYYLTKSYYHYSQDEYDSSIANSIKALEIAERTNALERQITLRLGIGSAFYRIGQIEKKMEYARSIISLIEKVDDPSFKCQFYYNLFGAYYTYYSSASHNKFDLDSAELYNQMALQIARRNHNKRFLPYCYEALELINHERRGAPARGLMYLDSALFFGREGMNNAQLSELLINKANLYAESGNRNSAIIFADSGLFYSRNHPHKSVHASHLADASELFSRLNDHARALQLYREADGILDSIKSIDNARMVSELEEKYNQAKNEKTIAKLSQEKELDKLRIRLLLLGVAVALVVIALIVFIYRLSLLKQRQQVVESKYRLNQALINPHFISNALVSIQRFMLENNPIEASKYLGKFSKLMRQLLEYSREETITIEEEIDLLRNYLDLQKLRLKDKFNYEIQVDENIATSEWYIPPMFAQPFVENAIEHGIGGNEHGKIEIRFALSNNELLLTISDNGKGISDHPRMDNKSSSTKIIQERIALLNKAGVSRIQLQIDNKQTGPGTWVQLTLPISS